MSGYIVYYVNGDHEILRDPDVSMLSTNPMFPISCKQIINWANVTKIEKVNTND